ncbi:MAG: PilZ domain-containing protein [Deltaproteobacteria bacterium]|nr:PilZ domain-containing protein [Deltaproteobacteria bacterium]
MTEEKRRAEDRVTINQEFESFDAFIEEYVTNLSRSGAFIKTRAPLPVGTRVNLRFTVLHEDMETIEGVGEVVRIQNDPPGVGVVFSQLDPGSAALIERLLARRSAR